jgi:hypothetical protein
MTIRPNIDQITTVLQALEDKSREAEGPLAKREADVAITALRWSLGLSFPAALAPEWFVELIDTSLTAYEEKRDADNKKWNEEYERIAEAWDAWFREHGVPDFAQESVPNEPDEIAHEGRCIVFIDGDDGASTYVSNVLTNPTWGDILMEFDQAIPVVNDYHHTFMEGLRCLTVCQWPEWVFNITRDDKHDDVIVYEFCTGS